MKRRRNATVLPAHSYNAKEAIDTDVRNPMIQIAWPISHSEFATQAAKGPASDGHLSVFLCESEPPETLNSAAVSAPR